jgi:hypothetical protein
VQKSLKRLHRWLDSRAVMGDPFLARMRYHAAKIRGLSIKDQFIYLAKRGRNGVEKARLRLGHFSWRAAYHYYSAIRSPLPRRLQNVPEINLLAAVQYKPRHFAGRLTLLLNGPVPEGFSPEQEFGWRGLRADKFEVLLVPGDRDGMFRDPSAVVLAEKMAACIAEANARAGRPAEDENADRGSLRELPTAVLDSIPSGQFHQIH